jgi:hypothetical protein
MKRATCQWCGQPIRWMTTEKGRRMCLDPEPTQAGNVALVDLEEGQRARVLTAAELYEWRGRLWMPHSATCSHIRTRTGTTRQI